MRLSILRHAKTVTYALCRKAAAILRVRYLKGDAREWRKPRIGSSVFLCRAGDTLAPNGLRLCGLCAISTRGGVDADGRVGTAVWEGAPGSVTLSSGVIVSSWVAEGGGFNSPVFSSLEQAASGRQSSTANIRLIDFL